MLTSADRPQTEGTFGRSDPGPRCRRAGDDPAVNLPSWAAFPPKKSGQVPAFGGGGCSLQNSIDPHYAHLCVRKNVYTRIKHIKREHP